MTKFFNNFEKSYLWPTFGPILGQKYFFSENSCGSLIPFKNLEKTYDPIQRKLLDKRMDRWIDRQTEGQTDAILLNPSSNHLRFIKKI